MIRQQLFENFAPCDEAASGCHAREARRPPRLVYIGGQLVSASRAARASR